MVCFVFIIHYNDIILTILYPFLALSVAGQNYHQLDYRVHITPSISKKVLVIFDIDQFSEWSIPHSEGYLAVSSKFSISINTT